MNQRWTPAVTIESHNGTREIQLYSELLSNRNIFLQGEITEETANEFLTQFLYLTSQSSDEIKLYINSPGGNITAGLVIYDLIQSSPAPSSSTVREWQPAWRQSFWRAVKKGVATFFPIVKS